MEFSTHKADQMAQTWWFHCLYAAHTSIFIEIIYTQQKLIEYSIGDIIIVYYRNGCCWFLFHAKLFNLLCWISTSMNTKRVAPLNELFIGRSMFNQQNKNITQFLSPQWLQWHGNYNAIQSVLFIIFLFISLFFHSFIASNLNYSQNYRQITVIS